MEYSPICTNNTILFKAALEEICCCLPSTLQNLEPENLPFEDPDEWYLRQQQSITLDQCNP
jgi:hypothetical protein